jgi:deoxyribodipyrimidine photolyase-related protein
MAPAAPATWRVILGDQLSRGVSALEHADPARDRIVMMEVTDEASYVPHHPQKIILILSAMRHFAQELRSEGFEVTYISMDDPRSRGSFTDTLRGLMAEQPPAAVITTEASEWRVLEMQKQWQHALGVPVEIRHDARFFCSHAEFAAWANGKRSLVMEMFYRRLRQQTGILMQGSKPEGGKWNYDHDNRKPLARNAPLPPHKAFTPDAITREVIALVKARFGHHFGRAEPFDYPVTREDAQQALKHFIHYLLPQFGDYQDAMRAGEPYLYHSRLSPALNIGLLTPQEICAAAEEAYRAGLAPLNAVEGFIRQILGWREFIRGIYWLHMPGYVEKNALEATRSLPAFYWSGETDMRCLREAITMTRDYAYSHHIQRLMVTGLFALLIGADPKEVHEWYLAVYADAFEWVEAPNTLGMSQFADGGIVGTKPYAASGAYIHRMSDFCNDCRYDVTKKEGPNACPFNYLYWDFLERHETRLRSNPRLAIAYRNLSAQPEGQRQARQRDTARFFEQLDSA